MKLTAWFSDLNCLLYVCSFSQVRSTCLAHLIVLALFILISREEYKL